MDSFSIGISGLKAAQRAFDIIGNNVANAATDGYHRQRIELRPSYSSQVGALLLLMVFWSRRFSVKSRY
jgi:flagellar hook protein FlgE